MDKKKNIALIGFMGTGKTTVGKILAEKLNYDFVDTDDYIEDIIGKSIKDIFDEYGEDYFREKETEILNEILKKNKQVISTGGGLITRDINREMLLNECYVVSLSATAKNIYFRVKDNNDRPLLNTAHPERAIRQLLHKRYKYYQQCHYMIKTDEINIWSIVDRIIEKYNNDIL